MPEHPWLPILPDLSQTRVSVVIPAYNAAAYIEQALDSVLAQTHARLECIVVDDGSTDGTGAVVARHATDPRIRYLRQDNQGVSAARNAGIRAAAGDVVALLDGDDVWLPRKLELQLAAMAGHQEAETPIMVCAYAICTEQLRPLAVIALRDPARAVHRWLLLEGNGLLLSGTAVMPKALFDCCGLFDESLSTSADLDFAARVARHHALVTVPIPLALYRQHPAQMHLSLAAYTHDMAALFSRHLHNDRDLRRGRANLHVRIAAASLRYRDLSGAMRAMRVVASDGPSRGLALPTAVLGRRVLRRLTAERALRSAVRACDVSVVR